jgi:DNA topoisomerase-1
MAKNLVVVESPAKAKTIEKYLGKDFKVMASYGHVRDLVPKEGAVDTEHDFAMHYAPIDKNLKHVDAITKAMQNSEKLYLATDPDREGEAIAWHVKTLLEDRGVLKDKNIARVVFHQITKKAVQDAIDHPRDLSMDLVNAQQARRALDYLVGFKISPLLWKKVRPGLSAGRVQSPALRMIVERELEIEKFIPQEYWTIHAELMADGQAFTARLIELAGEKVEQFSITHQEDAQRITNKIKNACQQTMQVSKVTKRERKRNPTAPFITSTLQQEAARKLGFSASKTMQIAQQLYEGVETDEGHMGLITYMRTDSVTLAQEAVEEIRQAIKEKFGATMLPDEPRIYKTKSKNAQEAHEAIRPSSALIYPESVKKHLSTDQFKLYQLIWRRAIACQMIEATLNTVAVDFVAGDSVFRANGSTIVNPGFMAVYQESLDEKQKDDEADKMLPPLSENMQVPVSDIHGDQHFTEPPPRFSEASLVKSLEEHDIGRPSTYASIINTLKNRKYVDLDNKRFKATDVGRVVNRFLTQYFTRYVDYDFTAVLENNLDAVSRGDVAWVPLLRGFWEPFIELVVSVDKNVKRADVTQEKIDEKCPKCQADLSIRLGKRGRFIGCTAYPECDYTRNLEGDNSAPEILEDRQCPLCQHPLVIKHGRYGKFIGCSHYPECKHMEPFEKPKDTAVTCPKCQGGHILQRKSRRGKIFYSCEHYPKCDYALWNEPVAQPCPKCQSPILSIKVTKKSGRELICPQANCGYTSPLEDEPETTGE